MTANSRPRLLVVGATTFRMRAFATWQAMGLHVTLADGHSTSRYEQVVDEFHPLDVRDNSADVELLASLADRADGVTALADDSQTTVSVLAERAGLPSIGVKAAAAARSKSVQRALYDRAGMHSLAWREVHSAEDLETFFGERGGPAVLKPVDATGGLGALAVDTLDEARRKLGVVLTLSPTRTAIVEDRLSGFEVCVEAVISQGEVVFAAITDADHLDGPGFVCAYGRFGARRDLNPRAEQEVAQLADALGIRDSIIHAEYKVDGDDWVILETALRPGGAFCPEMTARTTGVNLYEVQARLALGRPVTAGNVQAEEVSATFAQVQYIPAKGTVRRFVPPAEILAGLPDVHEAGQQVLPGQRLRSPMSDGGRAGYVLGWGEDLESLHGQLQVAADRLCAGMDLRRIVHTGKPAQAVG